MQERYVPVELGRSHLTQRDDSDLIGTAQALVRKCLRAGAPTLRHSVSMKAQNGRTLPITVPTEAYRFLAT